MTVHSNGNENSEQLDNHAKRLNVLKVTVAQGYTKADCLTVLQIGLLGTQN